MMSTAGTGHHCGVDLAMERAIERREREEREKRKDQASIYKVAAVVIICAWQQDIRQPRGRLVLDECTA